MPFNLKISQLMKQCAPAISRNYYVIVLNLGSLLSNGLLIKGFFLVIILLTFSGHKGHVAEMSLNKVVCCILCLTGILLSLPFDLFMCLIALYL